MRRERFQLMYEILRAVYYGNHLITHIAYYTYSSYNVVRKYIDFLELNGLIETRHDKRSILVFLTEKGRKAIEKLDETLALINFESPVLGGARNP